MIPAFAITSTSVTLSVRIRTHCAIRAGGASVTLNCGYGHGFSVSEVVEMVKRISGIDFKVEIAPRRPGDPAQIVAASDRARAMLEWTPQYDDLATIITHALAWEQKLGKAPAGVVGRLFYGKMARLITHLRYFIYNFAASANEIALPRSVGCRL